MSRPADPKANTEAPLREGTPVNRRRALLRGVAAGTMAAALPSLAQDDRSPVTIYIGIGASMDFVARLLADRLREALDRPVVVMGRFGAGQRLAMNEVRRAAPDGRALLLCTSGPFAIYPNIYTRLDYDPVADFTPICGVSSFDVGIATQPQVTGANDLAQLIAWARARPSGDVVFGSAPGNGSLSHFVGLSIGLATGVRMTHVAYKESGVGVLDLAAGRLPIMITGVNGFVDMHRAGRLRLVAVSGSQRSPQVPEVPTLKEGGVDLSSATSVGLFGPAQLPPAFVRRVQDALAPLLASAAFKDKLAGQGMAVWSADSHQLAASLDEERKRFDALVRASGYVKEEA